jgi:CheY-like chemotaxis protein
METRHKILLLDDDPDLLAVYKEILGQLPSHPEIHTAATGARGLALLESESFRLLVCDLKMPKMDGLQVLSIVRRRYPELRTVVLTGVQDEEFRSRAYALGVDLFWLKPDTQQNMKMFLECLEALLGRDHEGGFRGVQSKSLMDLIQMESLSLSSVVLRVTRGTLVGKIWLQDGELIDAEAEGARGEVAFRRILEWKSGTFESLPAEPNHERNITKSVNALLLETAQAMDEVAGPDGDSAEHAEHRKTVWRLSMLTREGAEFVVSIPASNHTAAEGWGTQGTEPIAKWVHRASETARRLAERLEAGPLTYAIANGIDRRLVMLPRAEKSFVVGWPSATPVEQRLEKSRQMVASWDS